MELMVCLLLHIKFTYSNLTEEFGCQKELRKKAFERRMKSRTMAEKKFHKKEETTLMIMEDENGGSWNGRNTKKHKKSTKLFAMHEIKQWKAIWENERDEEERIIYAQQRKWELAEIKKQQLVKRKLVEKYEKTKKEANKLMKLKWAKDGNQNCSATENKMAYKIEEGEWAYLEEDTDLILHRSIEFIPSAADSNIVDFFAEIKCAGTGTQQANTQIYLSVSH